MEIKVSEADLNTALKIAQRLPEFDPLLSPDYYHDRLKGKRHLILIAFADDRPAGCKIGYDRYEDGSFYSWIGGVLPQFRNQGIARALAQNQQDWARKNGYLSIRFKTLNRHKNMLVFSILDGFEIFNVKSKDELENYRIELIKDLS